MVEEWSGMRKKLFNKLALCWLSVTDMPLWFKAGIPEELLLKTDFKRVQKVLEVVSGFWRSEARLR